jgi:hypothetical protein
MHINSLNAAHISNTHSFRKLPNLIRSSTRQYFFTLRLTASIVDVQGPQRAVLVHGAEAPLRYLCTSIFHSRIPHHQQRPSSFCLQLAALIGCFEWDRSTPPVPTCFAFGLRVVTLVFKPTTPFYLGHVTAGCRIARQIIQRKYQGSTPSQV